MASIASYSTEVLLNRRQRKALERTAAINAPNVLKISDVSESDASKEQRLKIIFPIVFRQQLQKIILRGSPPLDFNKRDLFDYFGMTSYIVGNPRQRWFHFHYCRNGEREKNKEFAKYGDVINAQVLSGRRILIALKEQFKEHSWSGNIMKVPIKSKVDTWYMQRAVSQCFNVEKRIVCAYVISLQKQHARQCP